MYTTIITAITNRYSYRLTKFLQATLVRYFSPTTFCYPLLATRPDTRLTELLLLSSALSCPFIVQYKQYNKNSIVTLFLFVYSIRSCCVRLRSAFIICLFYTHTVIDLRLTWSMYICVSFAFVLSFLMLNNSS